MDDASKTKHLGSKAQMNKLSKAKRRSSVSSSRHRRSIRSSTAPKSKRRVKIFSNLKQRRLGLRHSSPSFAKTSVVDKSENFSYRFRRVEVLEVVEPPSIVPPACIPDSTSNLPSRTPSPKGSHSPFREPTRLDRRSATTIPTEILDWTAYQLAISGPTGDYLQQGSWSPTTSEASTEESIAKWFSSYEFSDREGYWSTQWDQAGDEVFKAVELDAGNVATATIAPTELGTGRWNWEWGDDSSTESGSENREGNICQDTFSKTDSTALENGNKGAEVVSQHYELPKPLFSKFDVGNGAVIAARM